MEQEKRFSVRFPLDVLEVIKQLAREDGRSINSEIVWILREYANSRTGRPKHAAVQKDQAHRE